MQTRLGPYRIGARRIVTRRGGRHGVATHEGGTELTAQPGPLGLPATTVRLDRAKRSGAASCVMPRDNLNEAMRIANSTASRLGGPVDEVDETSVKGGSPRDCRQKTVTADTSGILVFAPLGDSNQSACECGLGAERFTKVPAAQNHSSAD
jgi:hypothetical protein